MDEVPLARVSRNSGLNVSVSGGTFGTAKRFGKRLPGQSARGFDSPDGEHFYSRNPLWLPLSDREYSMGFGSRPTYVGGYRNAGPGAYEPCLSTSKAKSPMDGPEYCHTTLKKRLPTKGLGGKDEGPGHAYDVSPGCGADKPKYSMGYRFKERPRTPRKLSDPNAFPGIGHEWGGHVPPRTTLPQGERFPKKGRSVSQSPEGDLYYSHCTILTADDYMKASLTPSLGKGQKTNFSKSGEGGRNARVGPGSYDPLTSASKSTSALDGALRPLHRRTQ
jgi:hypothetical protein